MPRPGPGAGAMTMGCIDTPFLPEWLKLWGECSGAVGQIVGAILVLSQAESVTGLSMGISINVIGFL